MKNRVTYYLDLILSILRSWNLPVGNLLNDGLSEIEILRSFKNAGLKPTRELIELYQWRNGSPVEEGTVLDDVQIIPGYHLLSLNDAIKSYLAMKDDSRWNPLWFPIFANGGGDFYAADLSKSDGNSSPIIGFILGESEQEVEYQDFNTMMITFSECFEKGIVYKTEEGYLEMDDDHQAEVAMKNNPEVEYWHS